MKKLWFILALFILGCSKAQLPLAPDQHATLLVTAIQANGESLDPAKVYLDGQLVGTTPYKNEEIQIGLHALRVAKEGFQLYAEQIFIEKEQFYSVEAILEPIPANEGELVVTIDQDSAMVIVKDVNENTVAQSEERESSYLLPVGAYFVSGEKDGFQKVVKAVEVKAGEATVVNLELLPLQNEEITLEFSVIPDSVLFGEPVPIQWQSSGYQVVIDQGVGIRGPVGYEEVEFANPGKKVFTATAYSEDNLFTMRQDSVFIKEAPEPILPVIVLSATRVATVDSIATISWYSQNADYLIVDYVDNADLQGSVEITFSTPGIRIVTATAFNQAGYASATDTIEVVAPAVNWVDDIIVPAKVSVRADKDCVDNNAATIRVQTPGKYQVFAEVWYNSGDAQLNESFYLLVRDEFGQEHGPQNPNAGIYKVVPDDPGEPHTVSQESGIFSLSAGTHVIEVIHYATISDIYPQFLNGPIDGPESVKLLGFRLVFINE
ncbi:MAG: PEGA domain-containing protein [bacterium]